MTPERIEEWRDQILTEYGRDSDDEDAVEDKAELNALFDLALSALRPVEPQSAQVPLEATDEMIENMALMGEWGEPSKYQEQNEYRLKYWRDKSSEMHEYFFDKDEAEFWRKIYRAAVQLPYKRPITPPDLGR